MDVTTGTLRPMTPADVAAVAGLEQVSFTEPWSPAAYFEELARDDRIYLVIEEGSSILAAGGMMLVEDDAHVMTLAVAPEHRRRGEGTRLLLGLIDAALERGATSLTLEVRASNDAAIGLYRRFGFETVGVRPGYYEGEDAVIMWVTEAATPEYRSLLDAIGEKLP